MTLKTEIQKGALVVANHSGGKDSQAMLITLAETVPLTQLLVVHASLGEMEWPGALELAKNQAEKIGVPFIVAKANKTLLSMVERRYMTRPEVPSWPSASTRQCTSDLKRGPIAREVRRYATRNGFKRIVNCLGFRSEESPARAKRKVWTENKYQTNGKRIWYDHLPIHNLSTKRVFEIINDAGQLPHPAYLNGNDRLSCVFCIMGSKNDIKQGAKHNPELFKKYCELESRTGYTMHMSRIPLKVIAESKQQ